MPDQSTTTLSAFWTSFFNYMQLLKGQTGPGSTLIIRAVTEGEVTADQFPMPCLNVQLLGFNAKERANEAKVWYGTLKLRIRSIVTAESSATTEAIDKVGLVDNHIDAYTRPAGMTGLEDGEWSVTYPTDPDLGGTVVAERTTTFRVNVGRGANQ